MSVKEKSDEELLVTYRAKGDLQLLAILFGRYEVKIFRQCMKYLKNAKDAEDACIDIFIELKDKLRHSNVSNFNGWIYTVSKNHALKKLALKSKNLLAEKIFSDLLVKSTDNEDHKSRLLELLPQAIDQLREDQRWCIVLFYLHRKSYKEIEVIKGYDFKKVKSSIIHGKKNLFKVLQAQINEFV